MYPTLITLIAALGPAVFGAIGVVLFKRAANLYPTVSIDGLPTFFIGVLTTVDFWFGLVAYMLAFLWFLVSLSFVKVSQFYPSAVGFNVLLTTLAACWYLNESVPLHRISGIVFVLIGVFLVSR